MSNPSASKSPPRGFVTFEAAAEMLWQDGSEPDSRWHIAFLQIVADSQGHTGNGKKGDISLDCWSANGTVPTHVRASQVPGLRKAFAWWSGLKVPENESTSGSKPRRGRPKGSAIAGDDLLVIRAVDLYQTNQAQSLSDAARIVSERALGANPDANYHRLRKKVLAEYKKRPEYQK